jgi:hypothetical protein
MLVSVNESDEIILSIAPSIISGGSGLECMEAMV